MEAPFSKGQRIICIDSNWKVRDFFGLPAPLKDEVVTCDGHRFINGKFYLFLKEYNYGHPKDKYYRVDFISSKFAPIQDQYADITAEIAAGVTETKEQPDKVIIPAKPETAPCENSFS